MALASGTRLGPYEITASIGAGGMGEVYRATDTNLGRQVAVKVLPDTFAHDLDRLARFEREAKTLAVLNHPNIAQIYGLEKTDGIRALVMELVDGPTLADRIAQGPIPVDEALPIAKQITEALEAAHEQDIIHRDLKPANIKVRPDGTVKVLDFGLAKALEPMPAADVDVTASPTITSPVLMTGVGVLLGTAAYMSPEQARGKPVDKRTDIWAFGCVLYEILTGKRCFGGDAVADTLAFVLTKEPDWSAIPADTPPSICNLLRRCLDKDRRRRIGDVAAALFAIDEAGAPDAAGARGASSIAARPIPLWRRLATYSAPAMIAGAAIVGGAMWFTMRPAPPRISRFVITATPATALTIGGLDRDVAITPDGSRVIYVGNDGRELFVRSLDALEPVSLVKGGAPHGPFVSPDGQWVGFFDGLTVLKKVAITGGPPVTVATIDGNFPGGATWESDDTIVFATNSTTTGLQQVSAVGGPTTILTRPAPRRRRDRSLVAGIATGRPDGALHHRARQRRRRRRARNGPRPADGHTDGSGAGREPRALCPQRTLVYAAANTLRTVGFDPVTLRVQGTPRPVVAEVVTTSGPLPGGLDSVVAADGTLAYVHGVGVGAGAGPRTLVWADRQGRETPIAAPPRPYWYPRVSPDGGRFVLWAADQEQDLWVWDMARLALTRLTFTPGLDHYPVWTPDGRRLIFASEREGARNLFGQAADGTGAVERLTRSPNQQNATSVTPDGTRLTFTETAPTTGEDVMQVEVAGAHSVTPLVQSSFAERNGMVSSDGRWLAYEANDSGQFEIYVRPYPAVSNGRWQVSAGGGTRPLWSRNGQELFFLSQTGAILRVGLEGSKSWAATPPLTVVNEGYMTGLQGIFPGRTYDISPDGQRFLVLKPVSEPNAPPPQLVVVQHFDEELKRLVPVN